MISCRAGLVVLAVVVVAAVVAVYFISKSFSSADQSSGANSPGPRATSTLQFLIVVNRHGNRGFYSSFPTNPYPINDTNFWPFGAGQLTVKGRDQLYALGTKIRSLYNGFLSDLYFPEDFKASSTLIDRTLQSGLMFLAGLFPPKGFEIWDGSILWQPIPLYPTHLDRTRMVSSAVSEVECPKFNLAQKQSLNKFLEVYGSNVTGLLNSMQPYTGMTVEPQSLVFDMMRLWDSLACVDSEGLSLPAWTKSFYPEPMADLAEKLYTAFTIGSDDMIRYLQGELFKEMVGLMRSKANNTLSPDRRMYYYSGHDHTLMGLLGILNQGDAGINIVNTRSALIFELHKDNQTDIYYIQVLYIDGHSTDLEPTLLSFPGCNSPCELNTLLNLTEKYYNITDYTAECQIV